MARVPDAEIERLKAEVSLVSLAEAAGVTLRKTGADLTGCCPFHEDGTPSLVISPDKNLWHCLGACQAGGSVIDWVMRAEGVSFRHAVELLRDGMPAASPAGRAPGRSTVRKLASPLDRSAADHELLGQVMDYYHRVLKESPDARGYLARRKIGHPEAIDAFRLGYADRTLGLRLPDKRRKDGAGIRGRLEALGIFRASGHEHFAGSLIVPVVDENGLVTEVYGRKIRDNLRAGTPAHLYLPGPHRGVWNLPALAASDEVILAESLVDALTFWCAGFRHVTASYGAGGFTAGHQHAFAEHGVRRVLIGYDRDDAGDRAARELAAGLMADGIECFRIEFPAGQDANDVAVAARNPADALGRAIRSSSWMGAGPGQARRRSAPLPEPPPAVPEPGPLSAAASSAAAPEPGPASPADPAVVSPAPAAADEPVPEVTGREVTLRFGERRWRVRGLDKASSFDVLRVNVMCSAPDARGGPGFHVDTLDLYSARARAVFVAAAAAELGVDDDVIRRDLGKVLLACERLADEAVTAAQAPADEPEPMTAEQRAAALALLRDPDLPGRDHRRLRDGGDGRRGRQLPHRLPGRHLAQAAPAAGGDRAVHLCGRQERADGYGAGLRAARGPGAVLGDDRPEPVLHGRARPGAQGPGGGRGGRRGAGRLRAEAAVV
jgi:DNA primase catalytic core